MKGGISQHMTFCWIKVWLNSREAYFLTEPTSQAHKVGNEAICRGKNWLLPEVHYIQWQSVFSSISRGQPFATDYFVIGWRMREQGHIV